MPPAPTLRQLRSLIAAADTGSLSAAALALQITQPAASQQVRELERALFVRLLERGGGATRPTAIGETVLAHARKVQVAVNDLVAAVTAFRDGETGRVRLGTGATACIHLLPPLLAKIKAGMPGLEIIIATGNTPDMLRRVQDGDLDAAVVTLAGRLDRSLEPRRLRDEALLAYAPTSHLPGEQPLRPAALCRLPLILYERGGTTRGVIDAWFRRAGQTPRPIMELGSVEAIKLLAESGRDDPAAECRCLACPRDDRSLSLIIYGSRAVTTARQRNGFAGWRQDRSCMAVVARGAPRAGFPRSP